LLSQKHPKNISNTCSSLEEIERDHIVRILEQNNWQIKGKQGVAAILGINPSTLRFRMNKLGIKRPERAR
jgi:formate hydrogenlyase transcriptional activator